MDNFKNILKITLRKLHSDLNISQDFVVSIHNEQNSWNFISKFAQFIEGFFTKILVNKLNDKDTYDTISNLPQAVRLNLANDLKLISKEQKFLFLTIAEIRNDYIHDISNIEVNLSDYLQSLKSNRKTEIYRRFKPFILDEKVISFEDFCNDCLNLVFTSCCIEIAKIHGEAEGTAAQTKHAEYRATQALKLLPRSAEDVLIMEDRWMVEDYIKEAKEVLKKAGILKPQFVPRV